jgi:Pyruvate/2-oxoacid:ferredoxin oxidoreductase gamma subunit
MERELMVTGIGGQGVQLATQVLARAAMAEGREVLLFGSYGGMMRGGNTDTTLVLADGPIEAPPVVPATWAAILMHHDYWQSVRQRLRPGSVVLVNTSVFEARGELDAGWQVLEVPATDLAVDVGNIMTASLVMVGAFASATGIVGIEALRHGLEESIPPYRRQHIPLNLAALEVGLAAVPPGTHPAWSTTTRTTATAAVSG